MKKVNTVKLREKVLTGLTVFTFLISIGFSFVDAKVSLALLVGSFLVALLNLCLGVMLTRIKILKRKYNAK